MKTLKQLLEDIQTGYAPKEISYKGYTTNNLHHVPDATKAFQATITRVEKGTLEDNGEILDALKNTDTYMKLNDMHLEQEKDLDPSELQQWLKSHEAAKQALTKIGEFEHHYDYWNSHNAELQYLKANQNMPQETESVQESVAGARPTRDELASRFQFTFNRTPAGKAREVARNREELKRKIKAKKASGGLAGPKKGQLPEEVEGVEEGYKEPTTAAGHAKMAAKIKKILNDTLADRGDRHGNPDPQRLAQAYDHHMQKAKEKSQGVAEEVENMTKDSLTEMDKSASQPGRDGKISHKTYGSRGDEDPGSGPEKIVKPVSLKKTIKDALKSLKKQGVAEEVEQIEEISAKLKQSYLDKAKVKHLQQFLGREPVRGKQELDKRRAAIQKTSKELTGKTHYQEGVETVEEAKTQNPYHAGYAAHGEKKTRQHNPYKEGSEGAAMWAKGWEHASDGKPKAKFTNENFGADFLAMARQKNPNARLVTPEQKKKEAEELAKKRADLKPAHAAPTGNPRPLGGYDPKSNRSYSESAENSINEGPYSSGQLKPSRGMEDQEKKAVTSRTSTIRGRDSKGVYTATMKDGKEVSKVYEEESINELSKTTLGNYIKKRSHDVATMGAVTRQHANDSETARKDQDYSQARKSAEKADNAFMKGWKYRERIGKAVDRLTKEEVELDEAVTVSHARYQRSHSKNATGSGNWMFTHKPMGSVDYKNSSEVHSARGSFSDAKKSAQKWAKDHGHRTVYVMESVELDEKTLTPAELKKREEIAKAMERKNPTMDKSRKMAIATAVAKRVAEQHDDAE
jgi:hypothetical protein